MSWRAVVTALDSGEAFRSRVIPYLHPMAGRPVIWHVLRALLETSPPPDELTILHGPDLPLDIPADPHVRIVEEQIRDGDEGRALRAAVTTPGMTVLVDGVAPLLGSQSVARLLRSAESGISVLTEEKDVSVPVAVAGEGLALASADDPRWPEGATRVPATERGELLRVTDRSALARAATYLRDRLVRMHQSNGVTFILPETTWVDVDVRIGADTVIYPSVVIEGTSVIQTECVIGPYSRIIESTIGKGAELKGWNYIARAHVRNHAVIEPYVRRGLE